MVADTVEERNVFSFRHFNAMQSAIFQAAYNGAENLVVTGELVLTVKSNHD
jgi:hypothetical protein